MQSVFFAEWAVFVKLNTVRIILFIFVIIIVSLFALCAFKGNLSPHNFFS